jgi:hypothetical protein
MGSDRAAAALRYLTYALQAALVAMTLYALVTLQVGLLVNVGLPLLLALFPPYVRYRYDYRLNAVLSLVIVTSAFLHAAGTFGPYTTYPWYDQLAHGVSASMIAGVGYALVRTVETSFDDVSLPPTLRGVFVVVIATAVGVVWEIGEFGLMRLAAALGGEPLLAQFGLADVILDLLFNAIGAAIVALWGTRYFADLRGVAERFEAAGRD